MDVLLIAGVSGLAFVMAYFTYGRWLAREVFQIDAAAIAPSVELRDDIDFVPTDRRIVFGHHFTSIAGTGPIVGPAIAVYWGWLPALCWIVIGAILVGAVHDFGALVVSMRNRGQTVGDIAGRLITPRVRTLFLVILFVALTIVLAVFGLVISVIFKNYPQCVLSVWASMPLAIMMGLLLRVTGGKGLNLFSILSLIVLYACVWLGVNGWNIVMPDREALFGSTDLGPLAAFVNPVMLWTAILMIYCFIASVAPVWVLLQPRDYINAQQLFVALTLLIGGIAIAGFTNSATMQGSAPVFNPNGMSEPMFPFLFITIACGACSGFHCLVSSGTTSKQVASEQDALYIGYGSMLLEGALAVLVVLACCAGLGMGAIDADGLPVTGTAAWQTRYPADSSTFSPLNNGVSAFVDGGANFLTKLAIPLPVGVGIVATLVACFAATTLDTATRLQRYVTQELGAAFHITPLTNKYIATAVVVSLGFAVACIPGKSGPGSGGMILWPLFGATNQLLAGLAFMVTFFYLWRRNRPTLFVVLPMLMMLLMPAWAMILQITTDWWPKQNWLLVGFAITILTLQAWMMTEAALLFGRVKGVAEKPLPPLPASGTRLQAR